MARKSRTGTRIEREEAQAPPSLVPSPTRAQLASAFSQALDMAEGKQAGHAARLSYISLTLARALELPEAEQTAAFAAALFHDAGAAAVSAETCRVLNLNEEALFRAGPERSPHQLALELSNSDAPLVVELLRAHPERGAAIARDLGFPAAVQKAIAAHHERWDGHGYPKALRGDAIPHVGRIVAAADLMEHIIASEPNTLAARRNVVPALGEHAGQALDPDIVRHAGRLARDDAFWLGLCSEGLVQELAAACPEQDASAAHLHVFATVFSTLADAKGEHTVQHSERTAKVAERIARAVGFDEERRELLILAVLLHHVGLLGVPARVIAKPDILSLGEMEVMRKHPAHSQRVLETVPGLEEAARWVGAHHERPDGKGYPEMLEGDQIPLEARIMALADTYVALTSDRPYRRALSRRDAEQVLRGGAGTQLDVELVNVFADLPAEATSSRSAPRSRRTR